MSDISVNNGIVSKGEKEVGALKDGVFTPIDGLHHKTVQAIRNELVDWAGDTLRDSDEFANEKPAKHKVSKSEPPEQNPQMGDKDPVYVEWFRAHHSEEEFQKKYGHRKIS